MYKEKEEQEIPRECGICERVTYKGETTTKREYHVKYTNKDYIRGVCKDCIDEYVRKNIEEEGIQRLIKEHLEERLKRE